MHVVLSGRVSRPAAGPALAWRVADEPGWAMASNSPINSAGLMRRSCIHKLAVWLLKLPSMFAPLLSRGLAALSPPADTGIAERYVSRSMAKWIKLPQELGKPSSGLCEPAARASCRSCSAEFKTTAALVA